MNAEQRKKIRELVREYSGSGTESLVAFIAGTDGLMSACQALLHSIDTEGIPGSEWLQQECSREEVLAQPFVLEVRRIVALFKPGPETEDHHAILGVSADAGLDEIKHAFRALSRRYHPDTALPPYRDNPEKFIAINRAYNALVHAEKTQDVKNAPREEHWRINKRRRVSSGQRKNVFTWVVGLLIVLVFISVIASMNYQKRAMLAGLQESRGAFIPPARKEAVIAHGKKEKVDDRRPVERELASAPTNRISGQDTKIKTIAEAETETPVIHPQEPSRKETEITDVKPTGPVISNEERPKVVQRDTVGQDSASIPAGEKNDTEPTNIEPVQAFTADAVKEDGTKRERAASESGVLTRSGDKPSTEMAAKGVSVSGLELAARSKEKVDMLDSVTAPIAQRRESRSGAMEPDNVFANARPHVDTQITGTASQEENRVAAVIVEEALPPFASAGMSGQALVSAEVEQGREKENLQARVDSFFDRYIDAYEQRNLLLFAKFFEGEAEENGKPFTAIMPTYLDLFSSTRRISLTVEERSCRLVDGMVMVDGRFKVFLEYADNRNVEGSGPIHFLLAENGNEMQIRKMDYVFHSE